MAVFVDYRCGACGSTREMWVATPPPAEARCGDCDGAARRVWSPVGLVGRADRDAPARSPSAAGQAEGTGGLCGANLDIPGLCTLSPTAARSLVARVRGDNRALEAEIAYQEHMQKVAPGTLTVGGHAHAHAHAGEAHGPASATPSPSTPEHLGGQP